MKIILAAKRGFCSGVRRAVEIALAEVRANKTVSMLHEIVHNRAVVDDLRRKGVVIVERSEDAPDGSTLILSAHGVSEEVELRARALPLRVIDATCPLVRHVQDLAAERSRAGDDVLLAGKRGHREVEGILGRIPGESALLTSPSDAECFTPLPGRTYSLLSQTTFFEADFLRIQEILTHKIPNLCVMNTICPSTFQRQNAVRRMAKLCDAVIVAGSPDSSNSRRLCEAAESAGTNAFLVSGETPLPKELMQIQGTIGLTSGASASEEEVRTVLRALLALPGAQYAGEME